MNFGSLFSGIGGMDLGLERAGMTCRWQVEIDPFCREVLTKHWPDVKRYDDIKEIEADELEPVGLVCGGFPCQDVSSAGKGAGIGGARSGLWFHMARIIAGVRPPWVLVENVPALRTRGADRVLADLEALEYGAWPLVVGAWAVGAPHRRDRVWIVGRLGDAKKLHVNAGGDQPGSGVASQEVHVQSGDAGRTADVAGLADPLRRGRDGRASEQERGAEERAAAARAGEGGVGDPAGARRDSGRSGESGAVWDGARREEPERRGGDDPCALCCYSADHAGFWHCSGKCGEDVAESEHRGVDLGTRQEGRSSGERASERSEPGNGCRWPARPGEPQHNWEAPRLTQFGMGRAVDGPPIRLVRFANRNALKALGNAVVPQVVEMIGRAINEQN